MATLYLHPDVRAVQLLHAELYAEGAAAVPMRDWIDAQATTLLLEHERANPAVAVQLRNGVPGLAGLGTTHLLARQLDLDLARRAVAREHGFVDWTEVEATGHTKADPEFERALDLMLNAELVELRARLRARPALATLRSRFGHGATLLHHLCANGVEIRRQVVPTNAPRMAVALLEAGADVGARVRAYGSGLDPLTLLRSSAHPRAAGVAEDLEHVLRVSGAVTDP